MTDDDFTDRDYRNDSPFRAKRRSRAGGGFERIIEELAGSASRFGGASGKAKFERIMSDVTSWFEDGGDDRGAARRSGGAGFGDSGVRRTGPSGETVRPDGRAGGDVGDDVSGRGAGQAGAGSTGGVPGGEDAYADEELDGSDSFRGRGPKNYRRSDERVAELVNDALQDDPLDASDIEVSVKDGDVTLSGTVASRRHKHHAENLAVRVSGVHDVDNRVRVKRGGSVDGKGSAPGGLPGDAARDADDYGHS